MGCPTRFPEQPLLTTQMQNMFVAVLPGAGGRKAVDEMREHVATRFNCEGGRSPDSQGRKRFPAVDRPYFVNTSSQGRPDERSSWHSRCFEGGREDRQMASGKSDKLKGRVKEAAGALSGNKKLKREGLIDQAVGNVKQMVEDVLEGVRSFFDWIRGLFA